MSEIIDLRNTHDVYLPRARGGYVEEAPPEIFTDFGWGMEPKEDGLRLSLQIGARHSLMIGRNRQDFQKGVKRAKGFRDLSYKNRQLSKIRSAKLAGTLLDGELTETFKMGNVYDEYAMTRQENGDFLGYVAWDCYFWKGKDIRGLPLWKRRRAAAYAVQSLAIPKIKMIEWMDCTEKNLQLLFKRGWEGGVAKNKVHPIPIGQKTHTHWWKLKGDEGRTVDAFIIGVTQGKSGGSGIDGVKPKLDGTAASLTMAMVKGVMEVEVGKMKHLPDELHADGFKNFDKYKSRVVEMRVSGWDGKRFRWPRFVKWREDKSKEDCEYDEQVGGDGK